MGIHLQSMFLSRNKKDNEYLYKPQFYYIKVGFKGVKIIQACFRDAIWCCASYASCVLSWLFCAPMIWAYLLDVIYSVISHYCSKRVLAVDKPIKSPAELLYAETTLGFCTPPNDKAGYYGISWLSACPSVCLSVHPSVRMFVSGW